ncbi:hypothetical protein FWJ25_17615 [Marinobacter salinexigens]|uniref:Uncharacterized protein n=1 Tax=Marinobacter salinexigens TaxID=2919747 RepID=A0A5B0VAB1_9GAMM|nr:hypothetical protein [Marinobacter salinexigens]KAA1171001.1 hypothetical protein FWJ25_17615 [Marinobacter salinexigens]
MSARQPAFLQEENRLFAGTGGISEGNAHACFMPAFKDARTGQVELSRYRDGRPAPFHLIDGLPEEWVINRDPKGHAVAIQSSIVSGFVRLGRFFTRQEASEFVDQMAGC